jgi:hypothetical protein
MKAKVHATCTNQMLPVFFDSKGLVYMHIIPRGVTINANQTLAFLGKFTKHLKKRTEMVERDWLFQWDTAIILKTWLAARSRCCCTSRPLQLTSGQLPSRSREWRWRSMASFGLKRASRMPTKGSCGQLPKMSLSPFSVVGERCNKCFWIDGAYIEKS